MARYGPTSSPSAKQARQKERNGPNPVRNLTSFAPDPRPAPPPGHAILIRPVTTGTSSLFRFAQAEFPWMLGPPDGRYLIRGPGDPDTAPPEHVLIFETLGAPERRRIARKRSRQSDPQPDPTAVTTGRVTIVDVGAPLKSDEDARAWLARAGEDDLAASIAVLNRALHAFRLVTADPYLHPVSRHQALVARIGFGAGEQVSDGLWTDARELIEQTRRQGRAKVLTPQSRLAAVLNGRERPLACEELILRARMDLDHARPREAALQVLVALDAALAELATDPTAEALSRRIDELAGRRDPIAAAAQAALSGPLDDEQYEAVSSTLRRLEAALRARAVENA
jgi:hypothetical protein